MKENIFKNIEKKTDKKTINLSEEEKKEEKKKNIVKDIKKYVRVRIEMGIFQPFELTDVYSLDVYIGIKIPKDLDVELNGKEICVKEGDWLVFDFNDNISYIKNEDFSSFYKFSKISEYQQLLSALQLFKIKTDPQEVFVKMNYNKGLHESEDAIFDKLTELIMKGNVKDECLDYYKQIIDAKYSNQLINYTILPNYNAHYLCKVLRRKKVPYALLTPLVESLIGSRSGDFDVDEVINTNQYFALIITLGGASTTIGDIMEDMNSPIYEKARSLDALSLDELIGFKSQFEGMGISLPGIDVNRITAQMRQEAEEEHFIYGDDDISKDNDDLLR